MPAGFRRHLVGKTLRNVCYFDVNVSINVNVNVEFKVTLHEQVRYRGTLQY